MEVIGGIASIGTILELSNKLVDYILQIRGAKDARNKTVTRIRGVMSVLQRLQDCARDCEGAEIWAEMIHELNPSLQRLRDALGSVADLVTKSDHSLVWPRIKKHIEQLERIVDQEQNLLELAFQDDVGKLVAGIASRSKICSEQLIKLKELLLDFKTSTQDQFQDVTTKLFKLEESHSGLNQGIKRVQEHQLDRSAEIERENVLNWLSTSDLAPSLQTASAERQPDTGRWLLNSDEYQSWLRLQGRTLFCPGIPGAGKTVMSSIVMSNLCDRYRINSDVGLAFFVFDFAYRGKHTSENILKDIIKQLVQRQDLLPTPILSLHNEFTKPEPRPIPIASLRDALRLLINSFSSVYLVLDALDECSEERGCLKSIVSTLFDIQSSRKLSLFVTSRFVPSITARFKDSPSVEIRAKKDDLEKYIEERYDNLPTYDPLSSIPVENVQDKIIASVDGVFLLARYLFDNLTEGYSVGEVRTALERLSKKSVNWTSAYDTKFQRIKDQGARQSKLAMRALKWIVFSKRPLSHEELRDALGFEEMRRLTLDPADRPTMDHILHVCSGLLIVEKDDTVRLIHYTLREYLDLKKDYWFPGAEESITNVCVHYLSADAFRIPIGTVNVSPRFEAKHYSLIEYDPGAFLDDPTWRHSRFYSYAAGNWGNHARQAPASQNQVMSFLRMPSNVESAGQVLRGFFMNFGEASPSAENIKPLHLAAHFGLEYAVMALLELLPKPDVVDSNGETPLIVAMENEKEEVVKLLLSRGASPTFVSDGSTPLIQAIHCFSKAMVKILLDAGANANGVEQGAVPNVNFRDECPLNEAAKWGNVDIVEILIRYGAEVDKVSNVSNDGRVTPLLSASANGHLGVCKRLYQAGANAYCKTRQNKSPLFWAYKRGHKHIVDWLLSLDYDNMVKLQAIDLALLKLEHEFLELSKLAPKDPCDLTPQEAQFESERNLKLEECKQLLLDEKAMLERSQSL